MRLTRRSTLADVAAVVAAALEAAGMFYHWSDRQSLQVAVEVALARRVDMRKIQDWSRNEGFADRFEEFRREVERRRSPTP